MKMICKKSWPIIVGSVLVLFSLISLIESNSHSFASTIVSGVGAADQELHIALSTVVEGVLGLLLTIIGFFIVRQLNRYDNSISDLGNKIVHLDNSDISLKAELKQHLSESQELGVSVKSMQVEMREVRDKMIELSVLTRQSMQQRKTD